VLFTIPDYLLVTVMVTATFTQFVNKWGFILVGYFLQQVIYIVD